MVTQQDAWPPFRSIFSQPGNPFAHSIVALPTERTASMTDWFSFPVRVSRVLP